MSSCKFALNAMASVGCLAALGYLFSEYAGDNCHAYSSETGQNLTASIDNLLLDTSVVNLLSKTCDASKVSGLFETLVFAAFFLQYIRQAISWKQSQLQRCILMTPQDERNKSLSWQSFDVTNLWFYHLLTFLSSVFYLLSISFILTQNIYVFASITFGNLICEHVVLTLEQSDAEMCRATGTTNPSSTSQTSSTARLLARRRTRFML